MKANVLFEWKAETQDTSECFWQNVHCKRKKKATHGYWTFFSLNKFLSIFFLLHLLHDFIWWDHFKAYGHVTFIIYCYNILCHCWSLCLICKLNFFFKKIYFLWGQRETGTGQVLCCNMLSCSLGHVHPRCEGMKSQLCFPSSFLPMQTLKIGGWCPASLSQPYGGPNCCGQLKNKPADGRSVSISNFPFKKKNSCKNGKQGLVW